MFSPNSITHTKDIDIIKVNILIFQSQQILDHDFFGKFSEANAAYSRLYCRHDGVYVVFVLDYSIGGKIRVVSERLVID